MRILADENIPGDAVIKLRSHGHDVVWVRTDSPGATDDTLLVQAGKQQRLLITFDKDFGDLIFRRGHSASCGVILFRNLFPSSMVAATTITETLDRRSDWAGHFSVVDDRRIRMIPLPVQPLGGQPYHANILGSP